MYCDRHFTLRASHDDCRHLEISCIKKGFLHILKIIFLNNFLQMNDKMIKAAVRQHCVVRME